MISSMETLTIGGISIKFTDHLPAQPILQLSEECPCSDLFRADFNQWLLDRFGTKTQIILIGQTIYASRKDRNAVILRLKKDGIIRDDHGY